VKGSEHALTQAQHQKVLFHNASKMDLSDPNCPVHRTYEADASLDTVMNNMFNTLAARAAHNKNQIVELLPKGHRDRMALMKDVITVLRPDFEKEEQRIGAIRRPDRQGSDRRCLPPGSARLFALFDPGQARFHDQGHRAPEAP
jgi:hypothetical protein